MEYCLSLSVVHCRASHRVRSCNVCTARAAHRADHHLEPKDERGLPSGLESSRTPSTTAALLVPPVLALGSDRCSHAPESRAGAARGQHSVNQVRAAADETGAQAHDARGAAGRGHRAATTTTGAAVSRCLRHLSPRVFTSEPSLPAQGRAAEHRAGHTASCSEVPDRDQPPMRARARPRPRREHRDADLIGQVDHRRSRNAPHDHACVTLNALLTFARPTE